MLAPCVTSGTTVDRASALFCVSSVEARLLFILSPPIMLKLLPASKIHEPVRCMGTSNQGYANQSQKQFGLYDEAFKEGL